MGGFDAERLAPLPPEAADLLAEVGAPPRLLAHPRPVHGTATVPPARLADRFPMRPSTPTRCCTAPRP